MKPSDSFEKKDGKSITFEEYYWNQYNIRIKDRKQSLLVSLPKLRARDKAKNLPNKPILLVPELCIITGKIFDSFKIDYLLLFIQVSK